MTVRNNEILVPITNFSNYEKKVKRDSVIADIESTFHLNNVSQSERKEKEEVKGPLPDHLKPLIDNISHVLICMQITLFNGCKDIACEIRDAVHRAATAQRE